MQPMGGESTRGRSPLRLSLLLAGVAGLPGCASSPDPGFPEGSTPRYQTAWPAHDTSRDLTSAFRSVKQIYHTGEYRTYVFPESAGITEADLADLAEGSVPEGAIQSYPEVQTKAGTATILARAGDRILLLTSHHVVHFAPVRIEFYEPPGGGPPRPGVRRIVASVSYLTAEGGGLVHHPDLGTFQVLARDEPADIALLGIPLRPWSNPTLFPPLSLQPGSADGLGWGSFVYVLGYPNGFAMATRGIVSAPGRDGAGAFLTDGLWNEGISGGIILGVRSDSGRLEWVGMARAGAAHPEIRARPDTASIEQDPEFVRLYGGPLYVEAILRIVYGVTLSVPEGAIRDFVARSRGAVRARGYPVPRI